MARSIAFPLTIKALEFGKSDLILGGRPISRAFLKSALETFLLAITFSPFVVTRVGDSCFGSSILKSAFSTSTLALTFCF
jgi:hypothetical protein